MIYERILWPFRYRKAVWMADWMAYCTEQTHYVIIYNRRPMAVSREHVETLVKAGSFREGVTADDILARCAYCTGLPLGQEEDE